MAQRYKMTSSRTNREQNENYVRHIWTRDCQPRDCQPSQQECQERFAHRTGLPPLLRIFILP